MGKFLKYLVQIPTLGGQNMFANLVKMKKVKNSQI